MKIPEVASRMRDISQQIKDDFPSEAEELLLLADELKRRSPTLPPRSSNKHTIAPPLAEEIREFAEANPGTSHQDIAVVSNVNHGRVSEVISGKRQQNSRSIFIHFV